MTTRFFFIIDDSVEIAFDVSESGWAMVREHNDIKFATALKSAAMYLTGDELAQSINLYNGRVVKRYRQPIKMEPINAILVELHKDNFKVKDMGDFIAIEAPGLQASFDIFTFPETVEDAKAKIQDIWESQHAYMSAYCD